MAVQEQLPTNIQIVRDSGLPTTAFVFYLQSLQREADLGSSDITTLQAELDATQVGAGLNTGGNYIPPTTSNYINGATSLYNADLLLDTAIFNNTREIITQVSANTTLSENSQTVLIDATSGVINITLPNPANMFSSNRSKVIGITKIDTTNNKVNVLPFASELIVGETSQELLYDGEVLNFITDGNNWFLRS